MATIYECSIPQPQEGVTSVKHNIVVGNRQLMVSFQWATASEEQASIVARYLKTMAESDPLLSYGAIVRDYSYLEYYLNIPENIEAWLDTEPALPQSIAHVPRVSQVILIRQHKETCQSLLPIVNQYKECMRWQFKLTYEDEVNTGVVETGGWYRDQDSSFSFRFLSGLNYIGRDDLGQVTMQFEVYDA